MQARGRQTGVNRQLHQHLSFLQAELLVLHKPPLCQGRNLPLLWIPFLLFHITLPSLIFFYILK